MIYKRDNKLDPFGYEEFENFYECEHKYFIPNPRVSYYVNDPLTTDKPLFTNPTKPKTDSGTAENNQAKEISRENTGNHFGDHDRRMPELSTSKVARQNEHKEQEIKNAKISEQAIVVEERVQMPDSRYGTRGFGDEKAGNEDKFRTMQKNAENPVRPPRLSEEYSFCKESFKKNETEEKRLASLFGTDLSEIKRVENTLSKNTESKQETVEKIMQNLDSGYKQKKNASADFEKYMRQFKESLTVEDKQGVRKFTNKDDFEIRADKPKTDKENEFFRKEANNNVTRYEEVSIPNYQEHAVNYDVHYEAAEFSSEPVPIGKWFDHRRDEVRQVGDLHQKDKRATEVKHTESNARDSEANKENIKIRKITGIKKISRNHEPRTVERLTESKPIQEKDNPKQVTIFINVPKKSKSTNLLDEDIEQKKVMRAWMNQNLTRKNLRSLTKN